MSDNNETRLLKRLESPAVIAHVQLLQGIIARMAGNSAACKTWTVTLETALIALWGTSQDPSWPFFLAGIALAALMALLDANYLSLERHFRRQHSEFIELVKQLDNDRYIHELLSVNKTGKAIPFPYVFKWLFILFYLLVIALLLLAKLIIPNAGL